MLLSRTLLALLALAAATLVAVPPGLAATSSPAFDVAPAAGSEVHPDGGWYLLHAEPGERQRQTLEITNTGDAPATLRLAAVDAGASKFGGVAYSTPDERSTAAGRWLRLSRSSVDLAAGETAEVAFTVTVPRKARAGQHFAGLAVWSEQPEASPADPGDDGQAQAAVNVQSRRVVAVEVVLPGGAGPELTVTGVTPVARADGIHLEVDIANTGEALTTAEGSLTLPDGRVEPLTVDTLVADAALAYPVRWTQAADDGSYDVAVTLTYDGTERTAWAGSFTLGEELQQDLVERGGADPSPTRMGLLVPAIVVGLVLVVLLATALWLARRRNHQPAGRHVVAAPPAPPAPAPTLSAPPLSRPLASTVPVPPPARDAGAAVR